MPTYAHRHLPRGGGGHAGEQRAPEASLGKRTQVEAAAAPATAAPGPVDGPAAPGADDPAALERVYGDHHHDPHAARYERHHAHAERHAPAIDRFNRRAIEDRASRVVAGRPGVVSHGHGLFQLRHAHATRYTFVRRGDHDVAQPFDVIDRARIKTTNAPARGHRDERILVNPSTPRHLSIDGKPALCVLTWVDGQAAAWMRVADLEHGDQIAHAAATRAAREDPAAAGHDPAQIARHSTRYVIRNDEVGQKTPGDSPHGKPEVLAAGARSGDNLEHYLNKDLRKPAFDAHGDPTGARVTRSVVTLCMNLPEGRVPPVAIDTLQAGESFFAMNDRSFHRQTPVFANGAHHTRLLEVWVFGHVAMVDASGQLRPDPRRRGWLPLRVLAAASQLEVHDVAPRS